MINERERARGRKVLDKMATEIGAWRERKNDKAFQDALANIRDDERVVEIVAQFGGKIRLMEHFVANARRDAVEEAVGLMMHTVTYACADPYCYPVPAEEILKQREALVRAYRETEALPPMPGRVAHLFDIDLLAAMQAPLDSDPIVERRRSRIGDNSTGPEKHAWAVRARVQGEARRLFGSAGDRVTDAFVTAATGFIFSRDNRRRRRLKR
jgi:hypothetical protein